MALLLFNLLVFESESFGREREVGCGLLDCHDLTEMQLRIILINAKCRNIN